MKNTSRSKELMALVEPRLDPERAVEVSARARHNEQLQRQREKLADQWNQLELAPAKDVDAGFLPELIDRIGQNRLPATPSWMPWASALGVTAGLLLGLSLGPPKPTNKGENVWNNTSSRIELTTDIELNLEIPAGLSETFLLDLTADQN